MATTQQTIQGYYQNILLRTGSAADVTFWSNMVDVQGVPLSQIENTFVTCPEATTFVLPIVEIYQTYLGRAPDQAGFAAWVHAFEGGMQLSAIENAFATSAESAAYYGGSASTPADAAFVTKLYQTVLNRAPTPTEVTSVLAVTTNRATLQLDFLSSPEANVTLRNAANQFLTTVGTGNATPYSASLYGAGGTFANTFTLTPGADTIPGGLVGSNGTNSNAGNDLIQGAVDLVNPANTTLNAADNIDGGPGTNTLSVTYAGGAVADATNGALIANAQTFNIRNTTAGGGNKVTLDASLITGLKAVNNNLGVGNVKVTNLSTGASVGVIGNGTIDNGNTTATYVAAATAATINLSGGTTDGNVDVTGAGVTSTTINSTGAANKIGDLTISGKSLTVTASTNLTAATVTDAALTSITASGAATSVNLGSLAAAAAVKTIDASGLTAGGVSVSKVGAALTTFTGGGGNDTLGFAVGGITGTQTLDGGAGSNTLATENVGAIAAPITTGINASKNFQTLAFNGAGGVKVNQALITNATFTDLQFAVGGANPAEVDNAISTVNYDLLSAGAVTLSGAIGQTTLNAILAGTSTTSVKVASIQETEVQNFKLASNGSLTTTPNTVTGQIVLPDNTLMTITGSEALTISGGIKDNGPGTVGETIDATGILGKLTLNNATGNLKAIISTGTAGSDITASNGLGVINNITLGTGADKLSFLNGVASQIGAGAGTTDTATNFDAAKDSFALGYTVSKLNTVSGAGGGVDLFTDLKTAITGTGAVAASNADLVTLTGGADAGMYLVGTTGGAPLAITNTAIHLAGLTGTLGTSNFV